MLLLCRFAVADADVDTFRTRARRALARLTAADGALGGELTRSIEEPGRWVLAVRYASVHAYRRSLSPFEVREHVVPLLSEAETDEPQTYETLTTAQSGKTEDHPSLLA